MKSFLFLLFSLVVYSTIVFAQPSLTIPYVELFNFPHVGVQMDVRCNNVKSYEMRDEHFTLYENEKRIDTHTIYCPDSSDVCCISAAIIMDGSGSMGWPPGNIYNSMQQAASMFVRGMNGSCDYATVVRFLNSNVEILAPWTRDTSVLQQGIASPGKLSGSTFCFDAVKKGIEQFQLDASSECRAVIFVTDGEDNSSNISPDSCASLARKNGIRVFVLIPGNATGINDSIYQSFTKKTGGKVFYATNPSDLTPLFFELRRTIRNHFGLCQIRYESTCGDGLPKTIRVILGEPSSFCGGKIESQYTYVSPVDTSTTTRMKIEVVPTTMDTNSIAQIPVLITTSSDSVEFFLGNFDIEFDSTNTCDLLRLITTGTALMNVNYQLQSIPNGVRVILSERKIIHLPSLFCIMEVQSKSKPTPIASIHLHSDSIFARCHDIQFKDGLVKIRQLTTVHETLPSSIQISECFPNPVGLKSVSQTNSTSIQFTLQSREHIRATLYNHLGRKIKVLTDEFFTEGAHVLQIETQVLPPGMYNVVFESRTNRVHREFVIVK